MSQVKNDIPEGWVETTLGEVSKVQTGPFGSQLKNEQYITGGTPVITVEHIEDFRIKDFDYPSVTNEDRDRLSKYLLKEGDIVFTRVGSVDLSAYVSKNQDGWMFSSRMLSVRPTKKVDSKYLSYFFRQPNFRNFIYKISVGATMPSINTSILKSIPITFPKIAEQKAIAKVLTAFDDKIENLRAQNDTLEQTAQTIFTEWFGKYQIGDELPEGWRVGKLGEVTKICGGTTPSTKNPHFWDGDIHWTSPKDLSNSKEMFLLSTEKMITKAGLKKISSGLLPKNTLLLSSRAPIGYLSFTNVELAINQGFIALLADQYLSNQFMYLWLKKFIKVVENAGNGSTFLEISKTSFRTIDCIIPEKNILKDFDDLIKPLFDKILSNLTNIQSLSQTRDTLLPKLMSGQLRVKNIETLELAEK